MKLTSRVAALLALTALAGAASAQDIIATQNTPWKGFYAGGNIGGAWNHTCSSWEPGPTITGTQALRTPSTTATAPATVVSSAVSISATTCRSTSGSLVSRPITMPSKARPNPTRSSMPAQLSFQPAPIPHTASRVRTESSSWDRASDMQSTSGCRTFASAVPSQADNIRRHSPTLRQANRLPRITSAAARTTRPAVSTPASGSITISKGPGRSPRSTTT